MSSHILTYTGKYIDLEDPEIEKLDLRDIAHALSNIARFTGHTDKFYSVAQHSVLASRAGRVHGDKAALSLLFHDAHEAYLGDVSHPLKRLIIQDYSKLARKFDELLAIKFEYVFMPNKVSEIDRRLCLSEAKQLMRADLDSGFWPAGKSYPFLRIIPWAPEIAERQFIQAYYSLVLNNYEEVSLGHV